MKIEKAFEAESKELLDLMINSIYSEQEIFLRELLSNASDAIDKYRYLSLTDAEHYPSSEGKIQIVLNKKEKSISIIDDGIGMSEKDMEKNLGTIAKSGSKDFVTKFKKAKEKGDLSVIGQFGVGFYSAFMVAKEVEVTSCPVGGKAHRFSSTGKATYTIEEADFDAPHGTVVKVLLKKDKDDEKYSDYLEQWKISSLVKKYSDYLRYPIHMDYSVSKPDLDKDGKEIEGKYHDEIEDRVLNSMVPLWKKNPKEVTEDELKEFYKSKMGDYEEPLLSMNVHVEGIISYDALLFIPSHVPYDFYSESYEQGLSLYSHGIFIKDKYKELIPSYLKFVKGLVDSDDFPLNLSREMLQKTPEMSKIATNIENKILNELKKTKKNDPEKYDKFFSAFGDSLKFGIYSSYGFKKDSIQDLLMFYSLKEGKKISLEDYLAKKGKDQKAIYYAPGKSIEEIKMLPQLEKYRSTDIDVLLLDKDIDEFCLMAMNDYKETPFKNIASEDKEEVSEEKKKELEQLSVDHKRILDDLKASLKDKVDDVILSDKLVESPVCLSSRDGLSINAERVLSEQPGPEEEVKAKKVLEINPKHPLFESLKDVTDEERVAKFATLLYEEAMLLQGMGVSDKGKFIESLNALMLDSLKK